MCEEYDYFEKYYPEDNGATEVGINDKNNDDEEEINLVADALVVDTQK